MFPVKNGWKYAVALDTETTGFSRKARIVQIATLRFRWKKSDNNASIFELSENFRLITFIKPPPDTYFCPHAGKVTGITPEILTNAPAFQDIRQELLKITGNLPVVAHNAPFDQRMLESEFMNSGKHENMNWICSMNLARRAGYANTKLGYLAAALGIIPSGKLHDAGTDAELSARLTAHLCG